MKARPRAGRRRARRAAQAPRRHRADPREDRRARHEPHRAARARRLDLHGRAARSAATGCSSPAPSSPRRADHHARARGEARARPRTRSIPASVRVPPAREPVPRARLLEARPRPSCRCAASRTGSCSARCSSRSRWAPAAEPPRWSCPRRPRRPARAARARAHEAPGPLHRDPPAQGHRTFLLADEPGLGKTAQSRARGIRRRRLPAARGRAERREDELGARGRAVDAAPPRDRHPRRRRHARRVRRRRHRQLRRARPAHGVALDARVPRHGRRRGALHQEPAVAALAATCSRSPSASARRARRRPAAARAHRHPAHQRRRRLPRDLAVPRLDHGRQAVACPARQARGDRPHARRPRLLLRGARAP